MKILYLSTSAGGKEGDLVSVGERRIQSVEVMYILPVSQNDGAGNGGAGLIYQFEEKGLRTPSLALLQQAANCGDGRTVELGYSEMNAQCCKKLYPYHLYLF